MKVASLPCIGAVALAILPSVQGLTTVETFAGARFEDGSRELMSYTVVFEDCLGLTLADCEDVIQQHVTENPAIFENRESLNYQVAKVRELGDADYYNVALRTNLAGTGVVGIDGDGLVYYPYDWCTPTASGEDCRSIGPWDCDVGTPLTVEQCCTMIKASVPNADVRGNELTCFVDYPVGGTQNPTDLGRVRIPVNGQNVVVGVPKNE